MWEGGENLTKRSQLEQECLNSSRETGDLVFVQDKSEGKEDMKGETDLRMRD